MGAKHALLLLSLIVFGICLTQPAEGKEYPVKPIEIICPYTPGSGMDILARLIADIAPKYLGTMVVVNKPGAGGSLGAVEVITAKPDGYKLFIIPQVFFATTMRTQKVPFQQDDLVPLANFMEFKIGMMVKGDSPWKTFGDLLDYGRKNPGQLTWGHGGRGTPLHICPLIMFKKAGIKTVDVPYKGGPENTAALLGGHVHASSISFGTVKDHVLAGKTRFLVFYGDRRYADQPNVPSALELGYPEPAGLVSYTGIYAHRDTPEYVRKILIDASKKIYDDPAFKSGMERLGEELKWGGPDFMKATIKKAEDVGIPVIKELGLYVGK